MIPTTSYETREPNSLTAAAKFGVLANFLRGFPIAASFSFTITSCKLNTHLHLAGSFGIERWRYIFYSKRKAKQYKQKTSTQN